MIRSSLILLLLAFLLTKHGVHGEEDGQGSGDNADNDEYEEVESGRIAHAQCTAFTTQSTLDNSTAAILDSIGIFYVSTKSYMFYDYTSSSGDGGGDDYSYSTNMMVDLEEWTASMAGTKGQLNSPNCTLIENASDVFSDSRKVHALFSEDEDAALYEGPVCGMGSDTKRVDVGVFFDEYCTLLAPKLMYSYRKKVARGHVDSQVASAIDVVATASKKTLSCKKYPICGELLGESVSTQFCNQYGGEERFLEEEDAENEEEAANGENDEEAAQNDEQQDGDEANGQDENANEQGDQYDGADDASSNNNNTSWYNNWMNDGFSSKPQGDYSLGSYQLSQNDLYDMGSVCYAAVTSMNEGATLEAYLKYHGQLKTRSPRSNAQIVKFALFICLCLIALVLIVRSVKIRRVKKKKKLEEESDSDSSQASGTFASMDDGEYTLESGTYADPTYAERTVESGTYAERTVESGTYATMQTVDDTVAVDSAGTMASTMQGQLWQDLKATKKEFWPNEDQGQEIERTSTPMASNVVNNNSTKKSSSWRYSLRHARTPDDAKLPLVTEADEGVVKFNPPSPTFFTPGEDKEKDANTTIKKLSSWRPSLKTGNHRGSTKSVSSEK